MSQRNLLYFIHKNEIIIKCKKRAKELLRLAKQNQEKLSLMNCQNLASQELGYQSWFELHHTIKKQFEEQFKSSDHLQVLFDSLMAEVVNNKATDLHIEYRKNESRMRLRINGELRECQSILKISNDKINPLSIFIHNNIFNESLTILTNSEFISKFTQYFILGNVYTVHYQSLPSYPFGYDVVINFISHEPISSFIQMGYTASQYSDMMNMFSQNSHGLILVSGVTGSGKTTTMKKLIEEQNLLKHQMVVTIEDVNEVQLNKVTQIKFSPKPSYFEHLSSILRLKPDLLLVGELRDSDSMSTAKIGSLNVLTLSAVHANYALNSLRRINEIDQTKSPVHVVGLINQKLFPQVCPHCSLSIDGVIETILPKTLHIHHINDLLKLSKSKDITSRESKYINIIQRIKKIYPDISLDAIRFRNENACSHCTHGVVGRTICAEVINFTEQMRQLFLEDKREELENYWHLLSDNNPISENMRGKTGKEHAILKMFNGEIDPLDIESYYTPIGGY